jgi:hypothetical protein
MNPKDNELVFKAHQASQALDFFKATFLAMRERYVDQMVTQFRNNQMDFVPLVAKVTVLKDIEETLKGMVRVGDKENKKQTEQGANQ